MKKLLFLLLCTPLFAADPNVAFYYKNNVNTTTWSNTLLDKSSAFAARAHIGTHIYNNRDYDNIAAALTAIGATVCEFHIWDTETLTDNASFPATMNVVIHRGGQIDSDSGTYVPTFLGNLTAGPYQIFDIDCAPVMQQAELVEFYPDWWGTVGGGNGTDDSTEFQAAFDAAQTAVNGAKVKILPTGWSGNTNYYRFTTGLTYTFTGNAQEFILEGSGLGTYLYFDGAGLDGITLTNTDGNYAANSKNKVIMKNITIGGAVGTDDGFVLYQIRNSYFENCLCTGFGDVAWSLLGSFGNVFNSCSVGAGFGSLGNVAVASSVTGLYLGDSTNSGSNANKFTGGKIQNCTTGILIEGNSYGNMFLGIDPENNTTGVSLNSSSVSQVHQVFIGCDISTNGTDFEDVGATKSLHKKIGCADGGNDQINNDLWVAVNDNTKQLLVGTAASGYIAIKGTGAAAATVSVAGDPASLGINIEPKAGGSLQLKSGLGDGTGISILNVASVARVSVLDVMTFTQTPQSLSGPGAINNSTQITEFTSTGAGDALTISNGLAQGQQKQILHIVDGGSGALTGANLAGTSVTFTDDGDACTLSWSASQSKWFVVGGNALFAP